MVGRLKVIFLAATASATMLALGGCLSLGGIPWERITQDILIDTFF